MLANWRTEISALFGFIEHTEKTDKPGLRAIELAEEQDLVKAFKDFLFNFQYPGAHIKPKDVLEQIENGIKFKPAQYILKLLKYANKDGGNSIGITKFEACHCIFNDLRVTRDNEGVEKTWSRILTNRKNEFSYDQTGDVIRYAGDIIDYMEIANLLKTYDSRTYYLNTLEGCLLSALHPRPFSYCGRGSHNATYSIYLSLPFLLCLSFSLTSVFLIFVLKFG